MKCTIPEISWHNRDPVLSVDIQPKDRNDKNDFYRLASGGTDSHVLIWYMTPNESGSINLDLAADLTRHQRAVNSVKWSPNGELLASADDESVIFIWKLKGESEIINILETTSEQDKETWLTMKILRGHMEDVYDLSWSPNSLFLVSGSVDNTAIVWDVLKGKSLSILKDHKGFVQGVAWDPKNQYIATLSTDRYLRIFDIQTKKVVHRVSKSTLPVPEDTEFHGKSIRLFHDDTLQTFFRRLCFSPDGKLIITPAGVTDFDGATKPLNTTYLFSRYSLKQPSIVLPSPDQYTVAIKCCPLLFKLRPHSDSNPPAVPLPYRMIFAVASKSSVILYDTQQKMPFGLISNIHYTRLTDLTWSNDGRILVVSSTDGFCSLITFAEDELGDVYEEQPPEIENENEKKENELKIEDTKTITKPIEIKRKDRSNSSDTLTTPEKLAKTDNVVIIKEIISSVEKFDTPEKKNRPATPICIRRQPRSLSTSAGNSPFAGKLNDNENAKEQSEHITPSTTPNPKTPKDKSAKKAVPIAIRRKPRVLIPDPVENTAIVEEALDAWPLNSSPKKSTESKDIEIKIVETLKSSKNIIQSPTDTTTDIRLVYEDSQNNSQLNETAGNGDKLAKGAEQKESIVEKEEVECKTPRRIPLKTISTPKSKKKQESIE